MCVPTGDDRDGLSHSGGVKWLTGLPESTGAAAILDGRMVGQRSGLELSNRNGLGQKCRISKSLGKEIDV